MARSRNHFRVLQRKRYEAHRFRNPYFSKEKHHSRWMVPFLVTLPVVALLGFGIWLLVDGRFAVRAVSIEGTETIGADEISSRVWETLNRRRFFFFKRANRFLYDETELRDALSSAYAFESLAVVRTCTWLTPGGCDLRISVKEKTSQFVWISDDRAYLADLQGIVIRELTEDERSKQYGLEPALAPDQATGPQPAFKRLPTFIDLNGTDVQAGSSVLLPVEVEGIFKFYERLAGLGVEGKETEIDRLAGTWMAVRTREGYQILFDPAADVLRQAEHLEILFRDTIKDRSSIEYIDLRFGDHVYYKNKEGTEL